MIIDYVPTEQIYPFFGIAYPKQQKILIDKELSGQLQLFVLSHEIYHLSDTSTIVIWREIKANLHAGWRHPTGFILAKIKTIFSYGRLKGYIKLWWKKKGVV